MDFGAVLSRAWEIIRRHKVLWIFGILASCSNAGPSNSVNYRTSSQEQVAPQIENFFAQIPDWQIAVFIGVIVLVILLLIVLAIFLGTMGRIGLIRGTIQAEQGKDRLSFGELFSGGLPYFWRVFLINLLVGIALALAFIVVGIIATMGAILTMGIGLICILPLLCLLVPLAWLVSIYLEQANVAIVSEDLGVMAGLQRGWDVFRSNFGSILAMGLIVLVISLLAGFIIGIPVVSFILPALFGYAIGTTAAVTGGLVVAALCLVGYIPVAILLGGILQSYVQTVWALTYMRLTAPRASLSEPLPPVIEGE